MTKKLTRTKRQDAKIDSLTRENRDLRAQVHSLNTIRQLQWEMIAKQAEGDTDDGPE